MARLATKPGDLVLVTGAAGRIGANLCRSLLMRGYRVRAIALPGDPGLAKLSALDIEVVQANLREAAPVAAACEGVDAICHLAALMGPDAGEMPVVDYWHLNVDATLHVLEGARKNGDLVKFVFASTDATYGSARPRYLPIDENHPFDPVNLYGLTKVVGENMCRDYLSEFEVPVSIVRYGGVVTPEELTDPGLFMLSVTLDKLRNSKKSHNNYFWVATTEHERPWELLEPLVGPQDQLIALMDEERRPWQWHLTDVRDAVQGTLLALESEAAVGEAFNIVGPAPINTLEGARYLSGRLNLLWREAPVPLRRIFYEVSSAKARAVLDYRPRYDFFHSLDDGLAMLRGEDIGVIPTKPPAAK